VQARPLLHVGLAFIEWGVSPVIAVTRAKAWVRRYPELGTNWTFDMSDGPGDELASKAHLAVGGRGRGDPQHVDSSRIARAYGV